MTDELKTIIEALLFVSETPLPLDKIKKILETPDAKQIKQAIDTLSEEYESRKGAFTLREVAGGFQFRTRPEYAGWIKKLMQPGTQRLSKPALETLAVVAYKQPVIRTDIEFIRGVDCGGILRMLLEKKLIRVLGRKEIPGRPMVYATTRQFLELFDLKDLKDLPSPTEIEALGNIHALDQEFDFPEEAIGEDPARDGQEKEPEPAQDDDSPTHLPESDPPFEEQNPDPDPEKSVPSEDQDSDPVDNVDPD
ncbi:MAG: SMC-Scp complex subunit ScpB [Desulfobacteraceae bacterium]|nr:SMC-Scp complex subunit ScpB [Desulfobacteraceae bacterium]MBU4002206.1 SMC-Scp complex subunit ScpB [Pseudomonadota bacterium]